MRPKLARAIAVVAVLAGSAVPARSALADGAQTVTLTASAAAVAFGGSVTLSGAVSPPAAGEAVSVEDDQGAALAQATTDAAGAFSTSLAPQRNVNLHAIWQGASSAVVEIGVRAVVTVRLSSVRLFGETAVSGTVSPPHPGAAVTVALRRAGEIVASRRATMGAGGRFEARLTIPEPGGYRAVATFADADHLAGTASAGPRTTPLPSLHEGSTSPYVGLLERRLVALHYRLAGLDDAFDYRTADAVMAFRKVQRMARTTTVDAAVWRALADPKLPSARSRRRGFHFEVDQTRQVLYTVQDGEITNILHISTGKPSTPTHDGSFHVYMKFAGLTTEGLYYPSFFDGARALHGYVEVPSYAASHGCVRIPYWNALWVYGLAKIGTRVLVYHLN